jgi:hypothetical protein
MEECCRLHIPAALTPGSTEQKARRTPEQIWTLRRGDLSRLLTIHQRLRYGDPHICSSDTRGTDVARFGEVHNVTTFTEFGPYYSLRFDLVSTTTNILTN